LWRLAGPQVIQLVTGGVPDWLYLTYFAFALGYALTFGAAVLGRRRPGDARDRLDLWPLPFGAATALAVTFVIWRLSFRTLFVAVHQAYPLVAWYIVPMGIVIDLALVCGPSAIGLLPLVKRTAALRPHRELIVAALTGILAALALYGGMALASATGQVVPATPLAALPVACLTSAIGTALGYTVATRVRASVQRSSIPMNETVPGALVPAGSHGGAAGAEGTHLG
jgi:hypothetical protein